MFAKLTWKTKKKTFTLAIVNIKYVSSAIIYKCMKTSENAQIATSTTRSTGLKNTSKAD